MPIFARDEHSGLWAPSPLAAGPFIGLQGGAVAGLLAAEVESLASIRNWGMALSATAWFFRPTPMTRLGTCVTVIRAGGRMTIVDNTLTPHDESDPCATLRVTLIRDQAVEVCGFDVARERLTLPPDCPLAQRAAPHGRPWFMDAMEVRMGSELAWFRMKLPLVVNAGALSHVMSIADWAHGIARPINNVVADPNPNLTVQLARPPNGEWIGVRAHAEWEPTRGVGFGGGLLYDVQRAIGSVSMAVALKTLRQSA